MGKRLVLFVMMLGMVGILWAGQTSAPMMSSATEILSSWGTDTAQPDTIRYDDTGAGSYRLSGGVFYCSVRFTPLSAYDLRAAYLAINRIGTDSTQFRVWVARDSVGLPNPNGILTTIGPFTPQVGSFWYDITFVDTLSNNLHFNASQDFHVVYGPLNASVSAGPGTYPLLDQTADNLNRSYYSSGTTWPPTAPSYSVYGYDWRCRAGGRYASAQWVDLGVNNVDDTALRYFHCQNDTVRFRALIGNPGTLAVTSYTVQWDVRDASSVVVFTTSGTYGPIAVGGSATVTAPTVWSATVLGRYNVTATVTAAGDVVSTNNSKLLEQQVDNPSLAHLLRYDIPNFQVNLIVNANGGRIMKFTPCSMPVVITQVQVEVNSGAGNALIRVYGDNGTGAPNPASVLFSTTAALVVGSNSIAVPSVPVVSGSFFVAYIYADATTPYLPMDAEPSAGSNTTMPVMYVTADGGATWTLTTGGDHPLRAMVMPAGGTIRDISMDWMTFPGFFFGPGSDPFTGMIQVSNHGTATDTFNVSLTIEDTTFARSVLFTQTLPVVGLAVGDSTILTYNTYTFTPPGEFLLTGTAIVPGDAIPSDNTIMAETQGCVYPSELSYDDGTMEEGWAFNSAGNFWGARFDPPLYPCLITGMKVNFNTVPAGYDDARIQVIGDDGTTVRWNYLDTAVHTGWNNYTTARILIQDGFFYAGTEWVTAAPNAPYIGTDTDEPISYMARQRISGVWYYDTQEAGVRATVDAARIQNVVIRKTGGTDNIDINLRWNFPGIDGQTYYFIYKSNTLTGTYALVDSVLHPTQTWNSTNVPNDMSFYYVTLGNSSGARMDNLPGEYLWQPFEITASGVNRMEPGLRPLDHNLVRQSR
jgi:hypothetical protein